MVKWIEAVDPVLWNRAVKHSDAQALLCVSDAIRQLPKGMSTFVLSDYNDLTTPINYDSSYLLKLLADVDTDEANNTNNTDYISSLPDIVTGVQDESTVSEIQTILEYILNADKEYNGLYVIDLDRNQEESPILKVIKDDKNSNEWYLVTIPKDSVKDKIESLEPHLRQGKHYQFERNLGKGKIASKFSAYDVRNESYAIALLTSAFNTNNGRIPLHDMFTWDEKNQTYVHFMHSGNNEYHGYDITLKECPNNIRKIFGH